MKYQIAAARGDTVEVPMLVLRRLGTVTDSQLRVILSVFRDGKADSDMLVKEFSGAFSSEEIERALVYWEGAGLLIGAEGDKKNVRKAKLTPLSTGEVVSAAAGDPHIAALISEAQNLFGTVLNESDSNLLVSLYLLDGMPVDMILTAVSYFVKQGHRSPRYIARVLVSWQEEGIRSSSDLERYLTILARRGKNVQETAALLGVDESAFNSGERTLIARWHEEYGYGEAMILAAMQRAGEKSSVRYLNAILKKWHAENIRTPSEITENAVSNVQQSGRKIRPEDDLLLRGSDALPEFRKKGGTK